MKNIIILLFISLCSCKNDREIEIHKYMNRVTKDFNCYTHIYNMVNDTLNSWLEDSIANALYLVSDPNFQLDSLIIFNKDSTLCYTTINAKDMNYKDAIFDYINDLGGVKIDGKWYFFFMNVSMPVSRTRYKESKYTPYTFEELSFIAHKHRYPQVITWNDDGSYTVKDQYFEDNLIKPIKKECLVGQDTRNCFDSVVVQLNREYYKYKINPEELAEIKEAMAKSIKPVEPINEQKNISWWDRLWGKEGNVKLFESQEWKEYLKKKYGDEVER